MPRVTVLIPAFNAERFIGSAVQSILDQTFTDFELLIVNDGSTDDTIGVVRRFEDPRLRLVDQDNKGVAGALNRGLAEAQGDLIARMDADDIAYPARLERQVTFLDENPRLSVVGSSYRMVQQDGSLITHVRVVQRPFDVRRDLQARCPLGHPTVMYRRSAVLAVGGYSPEWEPAEDWDLWWRLRGYGIANLPDTLLDYRYLPTSAARSGFNVDEKMRERMWSEERPPLPWPWQIAAGLRVEWPYGPRFYLRRVMTLERARLDRL